MIVAAPLFVCLAYVAKYAVNVPYYDQWEFVPTLEKWFDGRIGLGDLFAQHNDHRIFFPRLVMLGLASATRWNVLWEQWASLGFLTLSFGLAFALYRRSCQEPLGLRAYMRFLPVALLIASLRQWENLLFGWQLQIFLCALAVFATVLFLDRSRAPDRFLLLAIMSGVVSTFSFANGLLIWPIGVSQLMLRNPRDRRSVALWSLAGGAAITTYLVGLRLAPQVAAPPLMRIAYLFIVIGGPLAMGKSSISSVGGPIPFLDLALVALTGAFLCFVLLQAVLVLWRGERLSRQAVWLAVSAFGFGSSLLVALGRASYGLEQALSSRYVTFTTLCPMGAYVLLAAAARLEVRGASLSKALLVGLTVLIVAAVGSSTRSELELGKHRRHALTQWAQHLERYRQSPAELTDPLTDNARLLRLAATLEHLRLSVFANTQALDRSHATSP